MWYILEGQYGADVASQRDAARPAHLSRLKELQNEGRLLMAGPISAIDSEDPGPAGFVASLIIAAFDSQAAAEAWIADDPYQAGGVYTATTVRPFKKVLP